MLRLNGQAEMTTNTSLTNSNTTNVKVKQTKKFMLKVQTQNSNTTNVKVKLYLNGSRSGGLKHSNTTNVKVKRFNIYCIAIWSCIQIQPMLRLNVSSLLE